MEWLLTPLYIIALGVVAWSCERWGVLIVLGGLLVLTVVL